MTSVTTVGGFYACKPHLTNQVRYNNYNSYNTVALEIIAVNSPCPRAAPKNSDCSQQ